MIDPLSASAASGFAFGPDYYTSKCTPFDFDNVAVPLSWQKMSWQV